MASHDEVLLGDEPGAPDLSSVDSEQFLTGLTDEGRAQLQAQLRKQGRSWLDDMDETERAAFEASVRENIRATKKASEPKRSLKQEVLHRATIAMRSCYDAISLPFAIVFLLSNRRFDRSYRLTWKRRAELGVKMFLNTRRITTGTSYKAHLAMAAKLFEIPPSVKGAVVECGCWKGGSTTNLSLICDIVGRDLIVYDSFEGLPTAPANDKYAWEEAEGWFCGELEEVKRNVRNHGAIERCTFRKGLFNDTLPHHTEPIVFAFLDVDYASSLHDCVLNLWPHLSDKGYIFIDEYTRLDYCGLFFSESWWKRYFDAPAPGMMGVGTGVGVGQYYLGPLRERHVIQAPSSVAYTRKDFYGLWDYDPDLEAEVEKARGQ